MSVNWDTLTLYGQSGWSSTPPPPAPVGPPTAILGAPPTRQLNQSAYPAGQVAPNTQAAQPKPGRAPRPTPAPPYMPGNEHHAIGARIKNMPTPGGIGALVLLLLVLLFVLVPTNGARTRAQLMWDVARGDAELPGDYQPAGGDIAGIIGGPVGGPQSVVTQAPAQASNGAPSAPTPQPYSPLVPSTWMVM